MRVCLIPAAGLSSRMRGRDKLLQEVDGHPCLRVLADRAKQAGATVIVTLPDLSHPRAAALAGSKAHLVPVPDAASGMSASLKGGVAAVPARASGLMILPADMPDISAADMQHLWEVYETRMPVALRATTQDGAAGHPVIVSPDLFPAFARLQGDTGAAKLLGSVEIAHVALDGNKARCDLDTPEDWAAWRKMRQP